jgi:hypothetical protein
MVLRALPASTCRHPHCIVESYGCVNMPLNGIRLDASFCKIFCKMSTRTGSALDGIDHSALAMASKSAYTDSPSNGNTRVAKKYLTINNNFDDAYRMTPRAQMSAAYPEKDASPRATSGG